MSQDMSKVVNENSPIAYHKFISTSGWFEVWIISTEANSFWNGGKQLQI